MDLTEVIDARDHVRGQRLTGDMAPGGSVRGVSFEACTFADCRLDKAEFRGCEFDGCTFTNCSLSFAVFGSSTFSECRFEACKGLSVDWARAHVNPLSTAPMAFADCRLDYSRFTRMDLRQWDFLRCSLKDVDFDSTRLAGARMADCDLESAVFTDSDLRGLDLRGSSNYFFDVRRNRVEGLKVSPGAGVALLGAFDIDYLG
ncbi:Pentapeptide repeat-containing protein [Raineyella antarctica]|uniref:Pentapeptide repeat-containing protein n=1 Tax=Raineyella antarctica TaxID=1577474 RepID=A0A1G6H3H7_9ACTN|nr:pentapeptide repeat-containing protein [Raineyella antarctica]SDB88857.1 Pentapeptide repeat-containing protein [Raineyella antarctica]